MLESAPCSLTGHVKQIGSPKLQNDTSVGLLLRNDVDPLEV